MKEINLRSRMLEYSPVMTPHIIEHLEYNDMKEYVDQIPLGKAQSIPELEVDTKSFLPKMVSITSSLPDKAEPFSFEQ